MNSSIGFVTLISMHSRWHKAHDQTMNKMPSPPPAAVNATPESAARAGQAAKRVVGGHRDNAL